MAMIVSKVTCTEYFLSAYYFIRCLVQPVKVCAIISLSLSLEEPWVPRGYESLSRSHSCQRIGQPALLGTMQ